MKYISLYDVVEAVAYNTEDAQTLRHMAITALKQYKEMIAFEAKQKNHVANHKNRSMIGCEECKKES